MLGGGGIVALRIVAVLVVVATTLASRAAEFVDPLRHDIFLVTPKSFDQLIGRYRNNQGVALLLHFNANKRTTKKFINEVYNEAAKDLKGMARLGAIDCNEWPTFCTQNLNSAGDVPFIVLYPPSPLPAVAVEDRTKDGLTQTVLRHIPGDNVKPLVEDNVDAFLSVNVAIPKVILFSTKETSTPVLFKALSNSFKDRLSFGVVAPSQTKLHDRFRVRQTPTLMVIEGTKLNKPDVYTGNMTFGAIHDWLNVRAETFVKGGGFSEGAVAAEQAKPWLLQKVPEITGPSHQDVCSKGASLCVLFLSSGRPPPETMTMLEELSVHFPEDSSGRGASFRWAWIDLEVEQAFKSFFGVDDAAAGRLPTVAVVNPHKRLRFLVLPPEKKPDRQSISELMELIIAGGARFTPVKGGKLPTFAARDLEGRAILSSPKKEEL